MSKAVVFIACFFLLTAANQWIQTTGFDQGRMEALALNVDINYGKLPLYFILNAGQERLPEEAAGRQRHVPRQVHQGIVFGL